MGLVIFVGILVIITILLILWGRAYEKKKGSPETFDKEKERKLRESKAVANGSSANVRGRNKKDIR